MRNGIGRQARAGARLANLALTREINPDLLSWLKVVIASWRRAATGRYHEIRYEDLINDPEVALAPLLEGAGLGWRDECALSPTGNGGTPHGVRPLWAICKSWSRQLMASAT